MKFPEADIIEEILYKKQHFKRAGLERDFLISLKDLKADGLKPVKGGGKKRRRIIKGFASTSHKDRVDDIITPQALKDAEKDLMQDGARTVFLNHDRDMPIGKTIAAKFIKGKGLQVTVELSQAKDVDDIFTKIKEGVLNSFSIGGRFKRVRVERDSEGRVTSFKVLKIELFEVSVVGLPANPKAKITDVTGKSLEGWTKMKRIIKSTASMTDNERTSKMKKSKKKTAKKETKKQDNENEDEVELTIDSVKELIEESMEPVTKAVEAIADTVTTLAETVRGLGKSDTEDDDDEDEIEEDDSDDDDDEDDEDEKKSKKTKKTKKKTKKYSDTDKKLDILLKKFEKMEKDQNKRKGFEDDEDEDEDEDIKAPKKKLDSIDDEATVKYLNYIMNENPEAYEKLNDTDKENAKCLWLSMMVLYN